MKNLKKISLISFLACATLAGGILTANTEVETPVEDKYFRMETGAQVRVPDVVEEGAEDFDGLRFTAVMSDAYRKDVGELDALSVGMFIMPAEYASKPINKANCFGESACYYWDGVEAKTEDAKEILHVESYAYEATPGDDYLTMKASVWNMNAENLDKEFVAVAYVTDGTNYYFAETAQGAKAVSVAQKALLNPEDEIYVKEGDAALVESAYINAYLGAEGKEVAYTENVYMQQKDGGYELVEAGVGKTATVTSYNSQATPGAVENYTAFDYMNNKQNRIVLFDGTTEVDTYYNYSANREVFWNGDDKVAESNYMTLAPGTKTERAPGPTAFQVKNDFGYEGACGELRPNLDGWDGPCWMKGTMLPFTTNTLSMMVYSEAEIDLAVYTFGMTASGDRTELAATLDVAKTVPGEWVKVTMTFSEEWSIIDCFEFRVMVQPDWIIYYDNFAAEKSVYIGTKNSVPATFADGASEFTFDAPVAQSTTLWADEWSNLAVSAQYQAYGASEWSDLTAVDGKYTVPVADQAATYMVKFTATDGQTTSEKVYSVVNDKYTFWDLEWNEDKTVNNGYDREYDPNGSFTLMNGGANNGTTAAASFWGNTKLWWDGFYTPEKELSNITKIGFWLTTNQNINGWQVEVRVNGGWPASSLNITKGTHYYEVAFPTAWSGKIDVVDFQHEAGQLIIVDNIVLK